MKKLIVPFLLMLLVVVGVSAQENTPTPTYVNYTVIQGDTLGLIAARYHTTTRAIMEANNLSDPNLIYWGLVLRIPVEPPPTPEATITPTVSTTPLALTPTAAEPTASQTESATDIPAPPISPLGFDLGGEVFSFDHLDALRSAGMTWMKLQIQWGPGTSVGNARRAVEQAHRNGFKVLLQVSGSASDLARNPATYIGSFTSYLGELAAFAPEAIEVWGEMNLESGRISTGAYAQMLAAAFQAIKRGNVQTLVISGALGQASDFGALCSRAGCDDLPYLNGMAAAGVGDSADCIGMRYTLGTVAPDQTSGDARGDQFLYYYPSVVTAYASAFPTKPLCFTEVGYAVGDSPAWAQDNTPDERAEWLAQAARLARASGRILLFVVDNVDAPESPDAAYAIAGADSQCSACTALSAALRPQ